MRKGFQGILLAAIVIFLAASQAYAGEIWGVSIVGYSRESRYIFGYSGTWLDFDSAYYYDPEVQGELYWQYNPEVPLDEGYGEGYGVWPAQVWLSSTQYQPLTLYSTYSNHFLRAYYYYCYDPCYYYYWYDPFNFFFMGGGDYGGWYYLQQPYYDPYCYVYSQRIYVFSTGVSIRTPPDDPCFNQGSSQYNASIPCTNPTPTPLPSPTPGQCTSVRLNYVTERAGNGIPLAGPITAPNNVPKNSITIIATGTPVGGNYTWSTSSNKVELVNEVRTPTSSQITVKALSKSTQREDVVIDVTYDVPNCGSHTEHIKMTVQQPTSMGYLNTYLNQKIAPYRDTEDRNRWKAGWDKRINWQVRDQFGDPLMFAMPIADTINNQANTCRAPLEGEGTLLEEGKKTSGVGHWPHIYTIFSPSCLRRGNCEIKGYQEYTVNGWLLSNDRKSFSYQCIGISIAGDGTTPPTTPPRPPRKTEEMVDFMWVGSLQTIADDVSYQNWTNILNNAHAQGYSALLTQARTLARSLFQSTAYANLNRSDEQFVRDLYYAYLQRDPDQDGYNFWLATLRADNAQGLNGREHLFQGFELSTEFMQLVSELVPADPLEEACDPIEVQDCVNYGGIWNDIDCTCSYPCNSNEEQWCYYYGGWWDSSQCRCYYGSW